MRGTMRRPYLGWARTGERITTVRVSAAVLVGWLAVAIGLSWLGVYRGTADGIPTIQFGLLIPILLGVLALGQSATLARALDAVPQSWAAGMQTCEMQADRRIQFPSIVFGTPYANWSREVMLLNLQSPLCCAEFQTR